MLEIKLHTEMGDSFHLFTNKLNRYSSYDTNDSDYLACLVWDKIGDRMDKIINFIEKDIKVRMKILKSIWKDVSPYLMIDAI